MSGAQYPASCFFLLYKIDELAAYIIRKDLFHIYNNN